MKKSFGPSLFTQIALLAVAIGVTGSSDSFVPLSWPTTNALSGAVPLTGDNREGGDTCRGLDSDPDDFVVADVYPELVYDDLMAKVIYPDKARKAGIEGRVYVTALIGCDGVVRRVQISASDNAIFDKAASDAVAATKFTPAIQRGVPIAMWMTIPIDFVLN